MTEQTTEQQVVAVTPPADSRLEQLHASYPALKAAADAANKALKDCTDGIKAELVALAPAQQRFALTSPHGPALTLSYVESWRVDTKKLKAERPDVYVLFAKQGGSWTLKPAQGGAE